MNFDQIKNLPKKIDPCPIAEAIIELRFDTKLPKETLIGIIYPKFKDKYPNFNSLPITQLPVDFIESQPNLKYAPYYKLDNKDFIFQVGPRSFSIVCPKEYKGWPLFFQEIKWIFKQINELEIIKTPERLGIRYINFFKNLNIFENIKTELSLGGHSLIKNVNTLRTEFEVANYNCVYQITNNSLLQGKESGSSIDIDLITQTDLKSANYEKIIDEAHEMEKKLFFGILKDEFLNQLQPEY